jgi:hypothetical protein
MGAGTALVLVLLSSRPADALVFNLTDGAGLTSLFTSNNVLYNQVRNGFTSAANIWSEQFTDNVTVNITVDYRSLGSGILGETGTSSEIVTYNQIKTALNNDKTSALDNTAVANLQTGSALAFITNNSVGTRYLDTGSAGGSDTSANNNTFFDVNRANLKALGITSNYNGSATIGLNDAIQDATITFSSNFGFDFDRSNGIGSGLFDFIGVAAHEIGHSLGFISGVDIVDLVSGPNAPAGAQNINSFAIFNTLDLFRFSGSSDTQNVAGYSRIPDLGQGSAAYFSVDKGVTNLGGFSTGPFDGDGNQASHWKDNLGLGIMDPTAAPGELLILTNGDLRAFDAIGWDMVVAPEPGSGLLALVGGLGFVGVIRRRRS